MDVYNISYPVQEESYRPIVLALGYFDGVHLGHQQVIKKAVKLARDRGVACGVMTFDPHPKEVISDDLHVAKITPLTSKLKLFELLNVDICYVVNFTKELAAVSPKDFIDNIIVKLNAQGVVAGFDYAFGSKGSGNGETLKYVSNGRFTVDIVDPFYYQGEKISSTRIRENLLTGKVIAANRLLGQNYNFIGKVIEGDKIGRTLGFPTANLELTDDYIELKKGVYVVRVKFDNQAHIGVMNVGYRPTLNREIKELSYEIFILDFKRTIYEKVIEVELIDYIREEKKFNNLEELKQQISIDIEFARNKVVNIS